MFANVILPDVPVDQMRGLFALLTLIANPQSQAASDFLAKLSEEKDAAIEAAKQAAADRAKTEELARELAGMQAREAPLVQREAALAEASVSLENRSAAFNARMQAVAAAARSIRDLHTAEQKA
jgi:hypothetical protein